MCGWVGGHSAHILFSFRSVVIFRFRFCAPTPFGFGSNLPKWMIWRWWFARIEAFVLTARVFDVVHRRLL